MPASGIDDVTHAKLWASLSGRGDILLNPTHETDTREGGAVNVLPRKNSNFILVLYSTYMSDLLKHYTMICDWVSKSRADIHFK